MAAANLKERVGAVTERCVHSLIAKSCSTLTHVQLSGVHYLFKLLLCCLVISECTSQMLYLYISKLFIKVVGFFQCVEALSKIIFSDIGWSLRSMC